MELQTQPIRGRFAPTPSGWIHLGNARTALLSWLHVRSLGGTYILRMEDIDMTRARSALAQGIMEDLRWIGLDWDEGPDIGGPYGPYTQSQRLERFQSALEKLQGQDLLYPCFCSRADIMAAAHAPHGLSGEGPAYSGACRNLSSSDALAKAQHKFPSLRFKVPQHSDAIISFHDQVAGHVSFAAAEGGDFIIKRADGMFSYQLAVVVDDADMHMTDVLRGYDLLDSTPRQLLLYQALGLQPPRFAHVPLVLGPDGRRLAKRHGGVALRAMRRQGVTPEAVIGWLAYFSGLLDTPEPVKAVDLIAGFHLDKLPKEPVILTKQCLMKLSALQR
ncbi:tRNA glutamyl-Q(34) synthetase GluQRS [Paenibacillus ottowii]|uniref:Glutamyl-Q tRNA(Asp) synthetase n=1 Tax=Paenibacillus ottowii TaxID=2315729 RepID=A0ABY3B5E9_9BACL|nr:tRNA glutamyl-Q(34) synthetase GluQRS [Paenibacillus ottowii]TQR98975.1 tRNA glutamyl-Q(34) synthetase GluQRS [Paenibacillus ottowii]